MLPNRLRFITLSSSYLYGEERLTKCTSNNIAVLPPALSDEESAAQLHTILVEVADPGRVDLDLDSVGSNGRVNDLDDIHRILSAEGLLEYGFLRTRAGLSTLDEVRYRPSYVTRICSYTPSDTPRCEFVSLWLLTSVCAIYLTAI